MAASRFPRIIHLGAEQGVTGSAHLLLVNGLAVLVDCGMAQGNDTAVPVDQWPVKPSGIDYIFLTHAHIDHIGRIPELVKGGFSGEILMTHPTTHLLLPMLEDAMSFSDLAPDDLADLGRRIDELAWGFEYGEEFDLRDGVRFRFKRAGHILGSAFIRLAGEDPPWSITFSGDLGSIDKPLLPDPEPPDPCDLLILESTYGDTRHEGRKNRLRRLGAVLSRAVADGGKVFIPAFALGRTQELIYEMDTLASDPELREAYPALDPQSGIPVFLDSPLGLKITEIYKKLAPYWTKEARHRLQNGNPLDFEQLYAAVRQEEHNRLLELPGPAIVIAGSGMCAGGRIVDHLVEGLADPRNDVVFVGYQGEGTPGREIVRLGNRPDAHVVLDGERVPIRAKVHVLSGYSAHADGDGLVDWVRSMPGKPEWNDRFGFQIST